MTKFWLSAAGLLALTISSNADAALVLTINGSAGTFGNTNVTCPTRVKPCAFNHSFNFTKPNGYQLVSATITSILTGKNKATNIDFTSVTLNGVPFDTVLSGAIEFRSISDKFLLNNNTINVRGLSGGNASYAGTLSFAAVPEPSTWMMMIVGVGIAGTALRRRRQAVKVSYA